ncbi:class F sortase [Citricoccus sp. K5]|uniref:class F sortase n=1 Tax=Citricoccus sp. K5 TaxID=2653135 RepID=UPI0012F4463A|nr:class F sortase [Citricoccus sp. K5]VXA99715.1 Sortase family protein [Citricoccus sp. K5]
MKFPTTGRRAALVGCAATALMLIASCSAPQGPSGAEHAGPGESSASAVAGPSATASPTQTQTPTQSPSPTTSPSAAASGSAASADSPEPEPEALPASEPTAISVPGINVESEVMQLGLQDNGVIEVPPYNLGSPAGWFVHSPTPGEVGPSVILGHRNGIEGGPGIFADLPQTEVGDSIEVTRQDGSVATFTVYRTELFRKDEGFPTLEVYGNTEGPEIRLITCDGLNQETGMLEDNFIVYATLDS